MLLALPIARLGLKFTPAEYFALLLLALTLVGTLATDAPLKGLFTTLIGLLLSTVGMDLQTGRVRFAFGSPWLIEGIDFIVVAIGLFAISEVLVQAELIKKFGVQKREQISGRYWITRAELKESFMPYVRGTIIGFLIGSCRGPGPRRQLFFRMRLKRKNPNTRKDSARGPSKGWRDPRRPTTPRTRGRWSPC